MNSPVLLLPGYGDSGPTHWQSLWQAQNPEFIRVPQRDWLAPLCSEWIARLETAVTASGPKTILVAHSLGCLLVAHWASQSRQPIAGALLVAPPDPLGAAFPTSARGFAPVPLQPLPFPAILVASSDDPYASSDFTRHCAVAWRAKEIGIGPAGHVNSDSGLGAWTQGQALLELLRNGMKTIQD